MARSTFVYVTYIRTTPEKLWAALTDAEFSKEYWFGCRSDSAWTPGSPWKLVSGWRHEKKPEQKAEGPSLCTVEIEQSGSAVKLSITHTIEREPSKFIEAVGGGWPKVISNLKSLLETGAAALVDPY